MSGTAQFHREIQRHYITFRDYFRKTIAKEWGCFIVREGWQDVENGIKKHNLKVSEKLIELFGDDNINDTKVEVFSDVYDDFTDRMIESFFMQDDITQWDEWFKREGGELYTYLNIEELIKLASSVNLEGERYTLYSEDSNLIPRNYYIRYLNDVVDNPEFEGKQIISFKKAKK